MQKRGKKAVVAYRGVEQSRVSVDNYSCCAAVILGN